MKQKCIVISYPIGRVGSSMLMGLLKEHGIFLGDEKSFVSSSSMNPKGFFELQDQNKILSSIFSGVYPGKTIPPAVSWVKKRALINKDLFASYLSEKFKNQDCFAIKSPRCLSLASFEILKDIYDVKVVFLTRNREEQVFSLSKVNTEDKDFLFQFLDDWYRFSEELLNSTEIEILPISFSDLIDSPKKVLDEIFKKFDIDKEVNPLVIDNWVNKKLVNRKQND